MKHEISFDNKNISETEVNQITEKTLYVMKNKMKYILTVSFLSFITLHLFGQNVLSGEYENGLIIAFDKENSKITGFFESYTGLDEETKHSKFSCIFYLEGKVDSSMVTVDTYYPEDKTEDKIVGSLKIEDDNQAVNHYLVSCKIT